MNLRLHIKTDFMVTTAKLNLSLILLALLVFPTNTVTADETAGKKWHAEERVSYDQIDHTSYDRLLQTYVDANGMVDYKTLHANAADRKALKKYLNELGKADEAKKSTKAAKIAYWINAYNALTIEGILRVYPTTSIRKHTPKLIGYNIWKNLKLISGDQSVSLDHIEHQILRQQSEPRIHFAIVCASIGCPRLLNQAYTGPRLEQQLSANATDFFSRSQNLHVDMKNKTLHLSKIMSWFGTDFGKTQTDQLKAVARYFPENAKKLVTGGSFRVGYLEYDWKLNSQKN